jgi:transcriptional regulator with XRE-family HTH domain
MKWNIRLRHLRNCQGWSQTALSKKLGTSTHTISRWERGSAFPSPFYRERLSQLFGMSIEELGLIPELASYGAQLTLVSESASYSIQPDLMADLEDYSVQPVWALPALEQECDEDIPLQTLFTIGSETHVEPPVEKPRSPVSEVFSPTFWLGLALSGIVGLTAAVILRQGKGTVL